MLKHPLPGRVRAWNPPFHPIDAYSVNRLQGRSLFDNIFARALLIWLLTQFSIDVVMVMRVVWRCSSFGGFAKHFSVKATAGGGQSSVYIDRSI